MTGRSVEGDKGVAVLTGITWDHPRGYAGLKAATDSLNKELPDSRLEWTVHSLADFSALPIDVVASKADLIVFDHPFVGNACKRELLYDLKEYLSPEFIRELRDDVVGFGVDLYEYDGGLWALPLDAACQVAAFRSDLCQRIGLRRDDLASATVPDIMSRIEGSNYKLAISFKSAGSLMTFFSLCCQLGAKPFSARSSVVPDSVGLGAIRIMKRIIELSTPDVLDWDSIECLETMARTDEFAYCPFIFGFSAYSTDEYGGCDGRHPIEFGPTRLGQDDAFGTILGGAGLGISRHCENPELAAKFVENLLGVKCQREMALSLGQPGRRSAWVDKSVNLKTRDFFASTLDSIDRGYIRPRDPGYTDPQDEACNCLEHCLRQGESPESILGQLNEIFGYK